VARTLLLGTLQRALAEAAEPCERREAAWFERPGAGARCSVQFSDRGWRHLDANASTYADTGYQSTWEASRAQPGRAGILVDYTGGTIGRELGGASARERARRFVEQLSPVLPGVGEAFNGRAVLDYWAGRPFTRGSYAYYRVGQMTAFAGVEGKPSGNCHFAGEQTSYTSRDIWRAR
jgi:monoamine oxidase